MKKGTLFLLAGVLVLALMLPACAPAAVEEEEAVEEHWSAAVGINVCNALDPYTQVTASNTAALLHIWEPLVLDELVVRPDGSSFYRYRPILATGYKFIDSTHLRFKLREGVKFHNGEDFTAADVKYSFDYAQEMPFGATIYFQRNVTRMYTDCRIIDDYTVELTLKAPSPEALYYLQYFMIVPKSMGWTEASYAAFRANPAGTGPYRITEFALNQYFELEAWDGWWNGVIRPKYLTIKHIPEPSARLAALLAGEVDIIADPAPEHLSLVEAAPDLGLELIKGADVTDYLFMYYKPPFNDVRVRQAVNYAVDRQAIVDELFEGRAETIATVIHPPSAYGLPEMAPYPYDPELARKLLAESNHPDGFEFELQTYSGVYPKDIEVAQAVQAYLAEIGITATIRIIDVAIRSLVFFASDFDAQLHVWGPGSYSPSRRMKWNLSYYGQLNPEEGRVMPEGGMARIYELWQEVQPVTDTARQIEIYTEINQLMYDQAATLVLYAAPRSHAYNQATIGKWEAVISVGFATMYYDYHAKYPIDREVVWEEVD